MKEAVRQKFLNHWDEMMADLAALIAINSVRGEATEKFPFGTEPARALTIALEQAARMGFQTDNVDFYAGSIDYGESDEVVGVMAHLDIVPAGDGWTSDPFVLTERDGMYYGRGVVDNKGPAIAALYGMRVLRELGVPLRKRIRLILGTNEEQGSDCLRYYAEHRPIPSCGFTPDANYPLINGEKGNFWATLDFAPLPHGLISMKGGSAFNIVPALCTATLDSRIFALETVQKAAARSDMSGFPPQIALDAQGRIQISCYGVSAHGSTPYQGVNAAVSCANVLCAVFQEAGLEPGEALRFISNHIGRETDGAALRLKMDDDISGGLTFNLGWVDFSGDRCQAGIDIRFPVTVSLSTMQNAFQKMTDRFQLRSELVQTAEPHYVPATDPLVEKLMNVYRDVTDERHAQPFTIGGGTYAKSFGNRFVAFGPELPEMDPPNIHNADEHIEKSVFLKHCVICTLAMAALAE